MKKSSLFVIVIVLLVIGGIVWYGRPEEGEAPVTNPDGTVATSTVSVSAPVTETTKVSSKTTKYENAELGFSVNYPTVWGIGNTENGVVFEIPIDQNQVSTVAKLESNIAVTSGKCAFPPVTTIKDRSTLTVGKSVLNTISMANSVQGRNYFDRMYSLQKDNICYMFKFTSVTQSPESKKLTGSNRTQAENNNKAIINAADAEFTEMVKTFEFVQGPAGKDETQAAPAR